MMLIRPPSSQKPYDNFFLLDPAFVAPPEHPGDTASEAELEEYAKAHAAHLDRMRRARETGQWAEVTIEGKQPTKFVMRPLPGVIARKLADRRIAGAIGTAEMNALAFRAAIQSIENFGNFTVKFIEHPEIGTIATEEVVNALDAITFDIVTDLGNDAMQRARGPSPK